MSLAHDVSGVISTRYVRFRRSGQGASRPPDAAVALALQEYGLLDRRPGKPSPKRAPLAVVEQVFRLYREKYFGLNVRHFHEKLGSQHQESRELHLSQEGPARSGPSEPGAQARGASTQAGAPPPTGDVAAHRWEPHHWFQDDRWYDLLGDTGRCDEPDLLRAAGGRGIDTGVGRQPPRKGCALFKSFDSSC